MTTVELPTDYQKFIHLSRYARWQEDIGGRNSSKGIKMSGS